MIPVRFGDAAPSLLPCLRPPSAPAGAGRVAGTPKAPLRWPVGPLLDALVVWDHDGERRYVTAEHVARWGVAARDVLGLARDNLPHVALRDPRLGPGDGDTDGYESARVLAFAEATSAGRPPWPVRGRPVWFFPHARALWATDDSQPGVVRSWLAAAIDAWTRSAEPISPLPYTSDADGQLVPWQPDDGWHPAVAASVGVARCAFLRREYAWQAEELGDDDLAPVEIALGADVGGVRAPFDFTRWVRGVDRRLPEVAHVVLTDPARGALLAVRFTDLRAIVGDAVTPTADAPPRWRTRGWPDPAQWRALGARAIDPDTLAED